MKNEKEKSFQNQHETNNLHMTYSEAMEIARSIFDSKNLLSKEQSIKKSNTIQDSTIDVMFIKRSRKK